jgi:hypothetical protein
MDKSLAYCFFGIQAIGGVSVFLVSLFFVGFGGGLDLTGYEFPGFSATVFMLPIVFPFTALVYVIDSRVKNQILASLLLIIVLISNAILALHVLRMLRELLSWFA